MQRQLLSQPSSGAWLAAIAVARALAGCSAAKQQLWPDKWDVLGPYATANLPGSWSDPIEATLKAGIHELWARKQRSASGQRQGRWQAVAPDAGGTVVTALRPGEQVWAVGEFKAKKSMCYSVKVTGTVLQAFLGEHLLPTDWPLQLELPKGRSVVYVRLYGQGAGQFHFKLAPCPQKLRILDDSEESPLPEFAVGLPGDAAVHLRVHNAKTDWIRGLALRLPSELNEDAIEAPEQPAPITLAPGQAGPVSLWIRLRPGVDERACPVTLKLRLEAMEGLDAPLSASRQIRCRNALKESYLFSYLDGDGSPQAAGVRAPRKPCSAKGCPVILSLHGMDVPAARQAYAYRPKDDAWVLAPHGRSKFAGLNWQNQGHRSAWAALAALQGHSRRFGSGDRLADVSRVIFTGHSNGGFGALLLAAEQPDLALGVAPLAGMLRMGGPATSGQGGGGKALRRLRDLLDASVAAYDLAPVAGNVAGVPCLARTGTDDEVIPPASTRQLAKAVQDGGGECRVVEVPGKGHWWWDSEAPNDGGAVDDEQMAAFWGRCFARPAEGPPERFALRCASADVCGGRGGLRLLQQEQPFVMSTLRVSRGVAKKAGRETAEPWEVRTENVLALSWTEGSEVADVGLQLDGAAFPVERLRDARYACRRAGSAKWHLCPSDAKCCSVQRRSPAQAGPLRSIFEGALTAVVGTGGGAADRHLEAALSLAGGHFSVGGGATAVMLDSHGLPSLHSESQENLLLLGGPESNAWTQEVMAQGALKDLRLGPGGKIGVGPCDFSGADLGLLALGPLPGDRRFALAVAASAAALGRLVAVFAGLRESNVWQARLPDYLLLEGPGGKEGVGGVLAAGFWGGESGWEWAAARGFAACSAGRSEL